LSNAFKFLGTQPKPVIEIGWRRISDEPAQLDRSASPAPGAGMHIYLPPNQPDDHLIEFFIKDNGIGIDQSDQQRIFLPFQRAEKLKVEGTGVGLSIVKQIIEGRGGTIRVESTPGQGSTFFFTIRAAPETDELTPLESEAASS
jgi:signal transduction histidine kinase